jgi:translocation and assembly module TamB
LRFSHAALGPRLVSAAGSFTRPDARFPAEVRLDLSGSPEQLKAKLSATIAGVPATADLVVAPAASPALRSIDARAGPVDPARFDAALPKGLLTATLEAKPGRTGYEGVLTLANAAPASLDAGGIPVVAARARFTTPDLARARLDALRIDVLGGGRLEGEAELDARQVRATFAARGLDLRALRADLRRTALQGTLDIVLTDGDQSVRGALSQDGMRLEAHVVRSGNVLDIRRFSAAAAGGEARGKGRVTLGAPLAAEAQLRVARFDPAEFGAYPRGSLSGTFSLDGRFGATPVIDAQWRLENSTLLGKRLQSSGDAQFTQERVSRASAQAKFGASELSLNGSFGRAGDRLAWTLAIPALEEIDPGLSGALHAEGVLAGAWDAHELTVATRSPTARVEARLAGGVQPGGRWQGEILSLTNTGDYPLRMTGRTALGVSRERAALGPFEAELDAGRLSIREAQWAAGRLATSGEFSALPARWLVLAAGAASQLRTNLLLDGAWSLTAAPRLQGTVQLRRQSGDLAIAFDEEPFALGLENAVLDARFTDAGVALKLDAASRYGKLAVSGEVGNSPDAGGALAFGPQSPLSMNARLDAAALSVLAQPYITQARVDGRLWAELQASGTLGAPRVAGGLRGEGLKLEMPPYGVYLRNGTFVAELGEDILRLKQFSIQAGTGAFTAQGEVPLRFAEGGAKLAWSAQNFSVLERPDLRLAVAGEGSAAFDGKRLSLRGELRAERGTLRIDQDRLPKPGEDVIIAGRPPKSAADAAPLPLDLDVWLDLGQNLRIESQSFEGKLTGRVRCVAGEDGALRAYGRVRMVNGLVFAVGQRLEVDPGELIFDGAIDNPALNVIAWRRNQAVEAGLQVSGNLRTPRIQIASNPPVSEAERLAWLVLGRAPAEASRADLGLLQAAAGTLLARGDGLPLDRRVARAIGLDELTLRGTGEAESNVAVFGKRLSDRLYVSYEQGLGATVSNLVKLDYALGRRWSLRAESGTTSGAGLFYRFSWD